jgi:hypothetical protein
LILTNSLSFFSFPETCSIFPGLFPQSPPESYFNSGDNGAWVTHYEKLKKYFSQFPYEKIPQEEQLWKDGEDSIVFIFLPGRLTNGGQNFAPFLPKLKVSHYQKLPWRWNPKNFEFPLLGLIFSGVTFEGVC